MATLESTKLARVASEILSDNSVVYSVVVQCGDSTVTCDCVDLGSAEDLVACINESVCNDPVVRQS